MCELGMPVDAAPAGSVQVPMHRTPRRLSMTRLGALLTLENSPSELYPSVLRSATALELFDEVYVES